MSPVSALLYAHQMTPSADEANQRITRSRDILKRPPAVFQFSALPGEVRNEIYRQYLGQWDAVIEYERKSASFKLGGVPEYDLMRVNRAMHKECYTLIPQAYSGRLILKDSKIRCERGFGFAFVSSLDVIASLCPPWLVKNTATISIEQGTTSMLSALPWSMLVSLEEIHLEGNSLLTAYHYPCALSGIARDAQEKDIFDGRYDKWCINGYNAWSQVPKPVADERVRVMTIRCGVVRGVSLRVQVQHMANHAEVISRHMMRLGEPPILISPSAKHTTSICEST